MGLRRRSDWVAPSWALDWSAEPISPSSLGCLQKRQQYLIVAHKEARNTSQRRETQDREADQYGRWLQGEQRSTQA
jgi:hypothetical protein